MARLNSFWLTFLVLISAFLAVFLYWPIAHMFGKAFFPAGTFSLEFFQILFKHGLMLRAILNSFLIGVSVTTLCLVLSLPLAWFSTRYRLPAQGLLTGLILLPMVLPPFVGAIGMQQFLARFGVLNLALIKIGVINAPIDWLGSGFLGVVILEVLHLYPIIYLNLSASLANINPALEEAAWNLGSTSWRFVRKILIPLAAPGLFAGCAIVFVWSVTDLGTPLILDFREVASYQVYTMISDIHENLMGYALVVFLLFWVCIVYFAGKHLFLRRESQMLTKGLRTSAKVTPGPALSAAGIALFLLVSFTAVIPHAMVLVSSVSEKWFMTILPERFTLHYFASAIQHPLSILSIRNSLFLSSISTIVNIFVGIAAAYMIARFRFLGRSILDFSVMLPLALPGLILAFGYVGTFAGTWLDPRHNPFPLLIAAYSVRRLPFMVRSVDAGLRQVDPAMEEAALCLGASHFKTLRRITVPLISTNVLAGSIFVFTFAMLEVSDSLILAMRESYYPLTKAIYSLAMRIGDGFPMASALGVFGMVLLSAGLLLGGKILGRRMGELFRM